MRAIWSGTIAFGLVNIPVKLYSAVREHNLPLDMIDSRDHARIRYKRVNENSNKEVPWSQIVKGYDMGGEYVVLTDEDFQKASPENNRLIEIYSFVNEKEIEGIYYEKPYYLVPEKNGERAYSLLLKTLQRSGMAGLGSYVLRNRQHLVLVKYYHDAILLHTIRYEDEIIPPEEYELTGLGKSVKAPELRMALNLVKSMQTGFEIDKYSDDYNDKLMKYIKARSKGEKVRSAPLKRMPRKTQNLMEQLKASLKERPSPRRPSRKTAKKTGKA